MWTLNPEGSSSADRSAYWAYSKPGGSAQVNVPRGASFLWLDPALTSPNVLLGIIVNGTTHYMAPGDVVPLPRGTMTLKTFNPMRNATSAAIGNLLGFVRLMAGTPDELLALMASRGQRTPLPQVAIIAAQSVAVVAAGIVSISVPTGPLRGIRVTVHPLSVGAPYVPLPLPADFACRVDVGVTTADKAADYASYTVGGLPVLVPSAGDPVEGGLTAWSEDNALLGSPGNNTWDRAVPVGACAMNLAFRSISGAGAHLTNGLIIVEGY